MPYRDDRFPDCQRAMPSARRVVLLALFLIAVTCGPVAHAHLPAAASAGQRVLEAASGESLEDGDMAWTLTATLLLLMISVPGFSLFYGGLVRKKNVLSVMMQCFFLTGWMSIVWALWGYSLSFGDDTASGWMRWLGSGQFLGLRGVASYWDEQLGRAVLPTYKGMPRLNHMLLQGMYFSIAPVLLCGAFAERMKFGALVLFATLWGTLVYCPLARWTWDSGPLAYGAADALLGGALDYAGGLVVHASAGVSAFVCALFVGKRLGYRLEPMPPHNLTYTTLGAALLWVAWFGFNTGHWVGSGLWSLSTAVVATHLSAASGAVAWAGWERISRGKPTVLGASSGAVAGLVGITSAAGFVHPLSALVIGLLSGLACSFACTTLKRRLGYDDSLDAFGIHGVGGTLGALLAGVFATRAAGQFGDGRPLGLIDGNFQLLASQLVALGVTYLLAIIMTFVVLKFVDATIGLRVSQDSELQGLDVAEHGEEGYIFL